MKDFIDKHVDELYKNTNSGGDIGKFRIRETDDKNKDSWVVADGGVFANTNSYIDRT